MSTVIKLTATAAFGHGGKQWIARITGRVPTAAQFAREFVGRKGGKRDEACIAEIDEAGLYETCDVDRKGNKDYSYTYFDGTRRSERFTRKWALTAAKRLAAGDRLHLVDTTTGGVDALFDDELPAAAASTPAEPRATVVRIVLDLTPDEVSELVSAVRGRSIAAKIGAATQGGDES